MQLTRPTHVGALVGAILIAVAGAVVLAGPWNNSVAGAQSELEPVSNVAVEVVPDPQVPQLSAELEITWTPPAGAEPTGYLIHDNWQFAKWVPAPADSYRLPVSVGTTHRIQVRAQYGSDNSAPNDYVKVTVESADPPPEGFPVTPDSVTVRILDNDTISLSWRDENPRGSLRGYLIHDNWQYLQFVPSDVTRIEIDVEPGTTHRYQVRAQAPDGTSSAPTERVKVEVGSTGLIGDTNCVLIYPPFPDEPDLSPSVNGSCDVSGGTIGGGYETPIIDGTTVSFCTDDTGADCGFTWYIGGTVDVDTITAEGVPQVDLLGNPRTEMIMRWDLV